MRILKVILLTVVLLVVGFFVFITYVEPALWPGQQRREAIRVLRAAKTPEELRKAITSLGAFITPTNGGWIAIRYRDTHSFNIKSKSVAFDSDGRWFECEKHFCGMLHDASRDIVREQWLRSEMPDLVTNETESVYFPPGAPSEKFHRLFTATNLDSARKQLLVLGFREFTP